LVMVSPMFTPILATLLGYVATSRYFILDDMTQLLEEVNKLSFISLTASQQEIKKAANYLKYNKVISILGDAEKRALYDDTALVGEAANNLQEYFRTMYKKVTEADVEEFEAKYRGSDSEKTDLKELYTKYKGNMNRLFCTMIFSEPKLDSHRFKDIIDEAISEGELKSTKVYEKWAKKILGMEPPTNPLERRA
ncbi:hypothetical protein ACJX0J_022046, partial [Zea mays]